MLKCKAKCCPKHSDCCCHNCGYKEFCHDSCPKDPKKCENIRDTQEERFKARTRKIRNKFWRRYIFFIFIILVCTAVIVGNQNNIMVMLTDILNQQNTIVQELDKQSIDGTAENRSQVNSEALSLGEFSVTYYANDVRCCGKEDGVTATGTQATVGRTVAVDPDIIPLGSTVIIDGHAYTAEDVGGAVKGKTVDIFVGSYDEAVSRGRITEEVFIR